MNPVFVRRLVGLIVLMAVFFGLSWLLGEPAKQGRANEQRVAFGVTPHIEAPQAATSATPISPATPAPELAPARGASLSRSASLPIAPAASRVAPSAIDERLTHPPEADSTESPEATGAPPAVPPVALRRPRLKTSTRLSHPPASKSPLPAAMVKASPPLPTLYKLPGATPPALAHPTSPPGAGRGGIWVQVGSFSQQPNAGTVLSVLQHSGFHGEVSEIRSGASRMFRVRLGPYASAADAAAVRHRLSGQGYPSARVVSEP